MISFRARVLASLSALLATALPPLLHAADPSLDSAFVTTVSPGVTPESYPTFDSGTGAVNAVTLQSDGKIILGGNISRYKAPPSGTLQTSLKRLNADGSLDTAFDAFASTLVASDGQTEINELLTVAGDKVYVGGVFTSYQGTARSGLLRLNANGTLDSTFDAAGVSNSNAFGIRYVFALAEQPDGKLLVGGGFNLANGTYRPNLARFNPNGSLDATFNPISALASSGSVNDIDVLPDGKILVGTNLSIGNFTHKPALLRLNSDGSLDSSFQVPFLNVSGNVQQVLPLPDGRIVISGFLALPGYESNPAAGYIAAVHADGSLDTDFIANLGTGPNGWVGGELTLQPDGTILAGGIFKLWNGQPRASLARIFPDGTLDSALALAPYVNDNSYLTHFYDFAVQPDGKIVAGGWFSRVTDPALETYNITRILNEFAPASPGTLRLLSTTASSAENAGSVTLQVSRFGGLVGAVSVQFSTANGTATAGSDFTATSDTLSWAAGEGGIKTLTVPVLQDTATEGDETFTVTLSSPTGGAVIDPARAQTIVTLRDDDSGPVITTDPASVTLDQGAAFTLSVRYDSVLPATVQWQRDPDGAGPLPFADIPSATDLNFTVLAADPDAHAGTYRAIATNQAGGSPQTATSATASVTVNVPAGSLSTTFIPANIGVINAAAPDPSGRILALTPTGLRRLGADGVVEPTTSFGITVSNATALLSLPDGATLVGGSFTSQTHQPSSTATSLGRLFRVNPDATGTLDTGFLVSLNNNVTALAAGASDKFYVGVSAASTAGNGVLRFLANGSPDPAWTPAVNTVAAGTGATVLAIRETADGKVLVSHRHGPTSGGTYRLSRLTSTGALDPAFGTGGTLDFGTSNWITGLDVLPDGRIAVAARFNTNLFATGQRYLAILHPDGTFDPSFQFGVGILDSNPVGVSYRDGRLLIWGPFTTVNGAVQGNLARLNLDGSLDSTFAIGDGSGAPFGRTINAAFHTASGDLFIGGNFTLFKTSSRNNAALLAGAPHLGAIGFAPPRVNALDSVTPLTLTLRRYGPATQAVSVSYATADATGSGPVTATAGQDYLAATGTVSWAAGDTADKTVAITVVADATVEPTESFRVVLSAPAGPATLAASATVTLIDADTPVTFTAQPVPPAFLIAGQNFSLSATTTSPSATTYQWFRNGVALPGATTAAYAVTGASLADAGAYTLVATNAAGSFTTTPVLVAVRPQPGRLAAGQATTGRPDFAAISATPTGLVALPDGGALIGGSFAASPANHINQANLIRVRSDGSTDTTFSLPLNGSADALLRQPDGKILVAGSFTAITGSPAVNASRILRLNTDLTVDTTFAVNTGAFLSSGAVSDLALDSTGRIYVAIGGGVVRYAADGTRDTAYTVTAVGAVTAVAVQPDDKLLLAGGFTNVNAANPAKYKFARLLTDGSVDTTFTNAVGNSGISGFNDLLVLTNGRVLALGGNIGVKEVNSTGGVATNLDSSTQPFRAIQSPDGKVLVLRTGTGKLYRLTDTLGTDATFNTGTGLEADSRAIDATSDGSIWIAGPFTTYNGVTTRGVLKLVGDPVAPAIVNPPANTGVVPGGTAYFSVGAYGSGLTYQWLKNGSPLSDSGDFSGVTTPILRIANVEPGDEADYTVAVTLPGAPDVTVTSAPARLYVLGAPVVAAEPVAPASRLFVGQGLALTAEVYAAAPATYVWRRGATVLANDARISGADTAALSITGVTEADTGSYTLTITNAQGTATTVPAFVLVAPLPDSRPATHVGLAANRIVGSFLPLPDGRMLIGAAASTSFTGGTGPTSAGGSFALVNPDGSISPVGSPLLNHNLTGSPVTTMVRQPDGKILVGGSFTTLDGLARNRLARLHADFSVDTAFDPGAGAANNTVNTFAVDALGRIYVGGSFTAYGGTNQVTNGPARNYLVRLLPDGSFDDTFVTKVNSAVEKLLPLPDGTLLVGGGFFASPSATPPIPASYLIRLDAAGVPQTAFAPNLNNSVTDLALSPAGDRIYAAFIGSPFLRRYLLDGTLDSTFNATSFGQNTVRRIAVQPDGKVLAYGSFAGPSNAAPYNIVRLQTDGTLDPSFTLGNTLLSLGNSTNAQALALDGAGRIWLGGNFTSTVAGTSATRLLVLAGDLPELAFDLQPVARSVDLGGSTTFTATVRATGPVTWRWFRDGTPLSDDARINGATTSSLSITGLLRGDAGAYTATASRSGTAVPPVTSTPANLAILAEPEILVAPATRNASAGAPFSFAASARGAGTLSYQWIRGDDEELPGQTAAILSLPAPATTDTAWYRLRVTNTLGTVTSAPALFTFSQVAGSPAGGVAVPSLNASVTALTPLADGGVLLAGSFGSLTPSGATLSVNALGFARLAADGAMAASSPQAYSFFGFYGALFGGSGAAAAQDGQGRIILAGNFDGMAFGGTASARVSPLRILANGNPDSTWTGPVAAGVGSVTVIAVDASDRIYLGGSFNNINGVANTARIARLDAATGALDTTFVSPITTGTVNRILVLADGRLLVGGTFGIRLLETNGALAEGFSYTGTNVNSLAMLPDGGFLVGTSSNLQRITSAGALVTPFPATGAAANNNVAAIQPLGDGRFVVAGNFTTYNAVTVNRVAVINADGTPATGFTFGTGFNGLVRNLALDSAGRLWASGDFTTYNGGSVGRVVALATTSFTPDAPPPPAEETDPFDSYLADAGVPANQRGATDDPDADGIANLLEFALGLDPLVADPDGLPLVAEVGGLLTLTYDRAQPATVAYEVQTTTDLANPASWTATGVTQGTPAGDGLTTASVPLDPGPRFLRLRVTLVAP